MASAGTGSENAASISLPSRSRPSASSMKQPRTLACVACQQRKIKCNREFPCSHCIKNGVQCIPANLVPKQRKRRFAERDLLDRLRQYETLLNKHEIDFEPLHPGSVPITTKEEPSPSVDESVEDQASEVQSLVGSTYSFWSAITQTPAAEDDPDRSSEDESGFNVREMGERMIKKAWEHTNYRKEDLIFGTPISGIDLSLFHPPPAQIFKLWQIYLDNVDPLLKVTHTPTLQPRIIDAISDLSNVGPPLNCLLFGIYCIAILTLQAGECETSFGASKDDMLGRYHFACQQALLQANFLRTEEIDVLTALFLYTFSMKPDIDARSLVSSLGVALRIAQRMGIHMEGSYSKLSVLDAELRRRLWWSLVVFDNRMCAMSNNLQSTILLPTWNCKLASNLNDFDLRPDSKTAPKESEGPSQAIFTVVRTLMADHLRNSTWYLDFNNPILKPLAKRSQPTLDAFEETLESRYLSQCNQDDALHVMTIWTARGLMAMNRFWTHLGRFPMSTIPQNETDRDAAISHAIRYIECDTQLLSSPLTKRFEWFVKTYSFFPAYIHIVQDLRKRPLQKQALKAWEVMSADWEARHHGDLELKGNPFFAMFSNIVLLAWEAREKAFSAQGQALEVLPSLVAEMYEKTGGRPDLAGGGGSSSDLAGSFTSAFQQPVEMDIDAFLSTLMPMAVDWAGQQPPFV